MLEIIIPANAKWDDIFQYYTGEKITVSDIKKYIDTELTIKKQRGGVIPGGRWIVDGVGRLVSVGSNAAQGAAEGAAAGAIAGPVGAGAGAVVGAVARTVIQEAAIEGVAAIAAAAVAGPAAPLAQRSIATGIRVCLGIVAAYSAYTLYAYNQPIEAAIEQFDGGGTNDIEQFQEIQSIIDTLKKKLGSDFDILMDLTIHESKKYHTMMPQRVFGINDIFTSVAGLMVLTNKEQFQNMKTNRRQATRKNNQSRFARR